MKANFTIQSTTYFQGQPSNA